MQANRESVRAFLLQPHFIRERFQELFERRELLMARATKTTAQLTGMPGGGGSDKEELYALIADTRGECGDTIRDYLAAAEMAETLVEEAPLSTRQKRVLALRYLRRLRWSSVIAELGVSERNVYYEHNKALDICAEYINRVKPWYWEDTDDG